MEQDASLRVERSAKTLRELTLEKMRDAILGFRFRPGERLVERNLCAQLGVSRTVVREVLRHLETEGLVETIPHQGPAVARPDVARAAQIYEIRGLLEALAAQACAEMATDADIARLASALERIAAAYAARNPPDVLRATTVFYEVLFLSGGKSVAWEVVRPLNARINQLRAMTIATPGREVTGLAEMRGIYEAVARRDPGAAYRVSLDHVARASALALATLEPSRPAEPDWARRA